MKVVYGNFFLDGLCIYWIHMGDEKGNLFMTQDNPQPRLREKGSFRSRDQDPLSQRDMQT